MGTHKECPDERLDGQRSMRIASVVLDRVLHHSHVLVIQGDSVRLMGATSG